MILKPKNAEYFRQWRAERRANGLCTACGKPSRADKRECHDCFTIRMQKRDKRKKKAVEYLGGQCVDCGYQTDIIAVYDFHHRDKAEKVEGISYLISANIGWKKLQRELDKCVLLCANCHRIRHALEHENGP